MASKSKIHIQVSPRTQTYLYYIADAIDNWLRATIRKHGGSILTLQAFKYSMYIERITGVYDGNRFSPPIGFEDIDQVREILDAFIHPNKHTIMKKAIEDVSTRVAMLTDDKHAREYHKYVISSLREAGVKVGIIF